MFWVVVVSLGAMAVYKGVRIVPQQQAWVVEWLGKYDKTLQPGMNFLIPFVQKVAYKHSLKEEVIDVPRQSAITKDNVTLDIDGVLYMRVIDPEAASYGVSDPYYALAQLAQTNMRSEIGKITLDNTFEERENLNVRIVQSINQAAEAWGIQCMRYEIKDINPPATVLQAMELQVAAERKKRAEILDSEGRRDAQINLAEAHKREVVLKSEAALTDQVNRAKGEAEAVVLTSQSALTDQVNRAKGEAEAIVAIANATAEGIRRVAEAIGQQGGTDAVSLRIAEQYINAFGELAKTSNTILLPANANDVGGISSVVAQAASVFDTIRQQGGGSPAPAPTKGNKPRSPLPQVPA